MTLEKLMNEFEAAELLGISVTTLRGWRCNGRVDLPFVRIGRCVRYEPQAVREFLNRNTTGVAIS